MKKFSKFLETFRNFSKSPRFPQRDSTRIFYSFLLLLLPFSVDICYSFENGKYSLSLFCITAFVEIKRKHLKFKSPISVLIFHAILETNINALCTFLNKILNFLLFRSHLGLPVKYFPHIFRENQENRNEFRRIR